MTNAHDLERRVLVLEWLAGKQDQVIAQLIAELREARQWADTIRTAPQSAKQ